MEKLFRKNQKLQGTLLNDLKSFRSLIKRKHTAGREFQSIAVQRKRQLTLRSL